MTLCSDPLTYLLNWCPGDCAVALHVHESSAEADNVIHDLDLTTSLVQSSFCVLQSKGYGILFTAVFLLLIIFNLYNF